MDTSLLPVIENNDNEVEKLGGIKLWIYLTLYQGKHQDQT